MASKCVELATSPRFNVGKIRGVGVMTLMSRDALPFESVFLLLMQASYPQMVADRVSATQ